MNYDLVHILSDLETRNWTGVSLAVIGHPIAHSLSPAMQNAGLEEMAKTDNRFADWRYFRFDIPPDDLARALPLFHRCGFEGLNLTIPHKVRALDLVDEIDEKSVRAGAVNTLLRKDNGYAGRNTDGFGLMQALQVDLGANVDGESVILLGAGGAARAAAVQCLNDGCRDLWIGNRSHDRLETLVREIGVENSEYGVTPFALDQIPDELPRSGILVNATSVGMRDEDPLLIDLDRFDTALRVMDMIYSPLETRLIREARACGMAAANGLSMLLWQGVRALEYWSGLSVPDAAMKRGLWDAISVRNRGGRVRGGGS